MSLAHALLTALVEHSCSGSELARRFDRSIGYFWPATHQQVYRELARLEREGWAASSAEGGRRRVYRALPAGRAELAAWVAEPREPKAIRDELLIKLRADAALGGAGLEATLRLRLDRHRAKLARYREIDAHAFAALDPGREQRLRRLILRAGIDLEELWIQLCEEALAVIAEPGA